MTDTLLIEPLTPASEPLWREYAAKHPEAGFYHHLWWRDLFRDVFRYESHHLTAKRGGALVGVMPLFKTPTLAGSLLSSVPFRDRAAPLADDERVLNALLVEAARIAEETRAGTLLVKSVSPLPLDAERAAEFLHSSDWIRSSAPLPQSREAYWKRLNDKTRNMIRQAENAGLEFALVGGDPARVKEAVAVLKKTQHRLGIPPFPERYYLELAGILAKERLGEVCAVQLRGRVVAAAILFFEKEAAVYAYAGSLPEAWPQRANDFLVWNALATAIDRKKTVFDFGSDSSRQDSLLFFKKKWGAEGKPLHYYSRATRRKKGKPDAWRDSSQGLYPLLRSVVRLMPRPLYELTGILTRYFG